MNPQTPEPVPSELEPLISLATQALNEHTNHAGLRVLCGCAWPREYAVLAERNLAAVP
jgi:hypothetical protein